MVGQIPGLLKLEVNKPLSSTAHRGQGFDMGLVAILEKADDVKVYAEHPAHLEYVACLPYHGPPIVLLGNDVRAKTINILTCTSQGVEVARGAVYRYSGI
jgi:hypothetical protein